MSRHSLIIALLVGLLLVARPSNAQSDIPYEPIYRGHSITEFEWQDSQSLKFSLNDDVQPLHMYSTISNMVSPLSSWLGEDGLYNMLKMSDPDAPIFVNTQTGEISFIYKSPDNQFMVYGIDIGSPINYGVAITNLMTGQRQVLEGVRINSLFNQRGFDLKWSANSAAFIIESDYGNYTLPYYIVGFRNDLSETRVVFLNDPEGPISALTNNFTLTVYDIDDSGDNILVDILLGNPLQRNLVVLNMVDFTYDVITMESFRSPRFERPSYNSVNYVSLDGVVNYNSVSHEATIRNADINLNWASDQTLNR